MNARMFICLSFLFLILALALCIALHMSKKMQQKDEKIKEIHFFQAID